MLKAILVDDEKAGLKSLEADIKDYCPQIEIQASFQTPSEAIKGIENFQPDIVFLDIAMPGMNGFEMLEAVGDINFYVIFVSHHEDHALQAFDIPHANYLHKPIQTDRLIEAVSRVEELINLKLGKPFPEMATPSGLCNAVKWIPFQVGTDYICIKRDDIIYFQAEKDHTSIFINNGDFYNHSKSNSILVNDGIGRCKKRLGAYNEFFRIHNSFMVNLNYVVQIKSRERQILLSNGKKLTVSISKWTDFLKLIKGEVL